MNTVLVSFLLVLTAFPSLAGETVPAPVMLPTTTSAGSAIVYPDSGTSGEFGAWTVTYTIGREGISKGGGIRVQMPDAWHAGPRNSANRLQASIPADDHYVSSRCSRPDAQVQTIVEHETPNELVKHAKPSLDGRYERYVFVVRVRILEGELEEGDKLSVIYGDRSAGSRGYRAGAVSTKPLPVLIAVDELGTNTFRLHTAPPAITIMPGRAVEMLFHAPSLAVVDEPVNLLVALVDKESNPVMHSAKLRISNLAGAVDFPAEIEVPEGKGYVQFEATPKAPGIVNLQAQSDELGLSAAANPMDVSTTPAEYRIYWGELHSHSGFSWDGVGRDSYNYARYVSGLDFYAMTDHANDPESEGTQGLYEGNWEEYTALVGKYHDPPHFVTLHAYECSFGRPFGHHNVIFRDKPGPLLYPSAVTLPGLWEKLESGDALTIPHHTGKMPRGVDFSYHDPAFRRNFEIYSGHGLSEAYKPDHPLAFENSLFTSDSRSVKDPTFAQDVWIRGLHLSTVASSDNHRGQPGKPHYGLAAVRATALTRNNVFQALYDRRTYGTTGAKIILDLTLNGHPMGQLVVLDSPPTIRVRAIGTDVIEQVEILRYEPSDTAFRTIKTWLPDTSNFREEFVDDNHMPGSIYYVRLKQKNVVRGRIVMAWSSPIWTRPGE